MTKADISQITDTALLSMGLNSTPVALFRRFLRLYDVKPENMREIPKITVDPIRQTAYAELYLLPGVKATRAELYCLSGYTSLHILSRANAEQILARTAEAIKKYHLPYAIPLPKEIRTHLAVAKAFTGIIQ